MVKAYWQIGRIIVEHEQNGSLRSEYGKAVLQSLSERLTEEFGKGFTVTNLKYMRQFYVTFPNGHALHGELTWTHLPNKVKNCLTTISMTGTVITTTPLTGIYRKINNERQRHRGWKTKFHPRWFFCVMIRKLPIRPAYFLFRFLPVTASAAHPAADTAASASHRARLLLSPVRGEAPRGSSVSQ